MLHDKGALEKNSITSQLYNATLISLNSHAYSVNESIVYDNACSVILSSDVQFYEFVILITT